MSSSTSSFSARLTTLVQVVLPFLLLVSFAVPTQGVVVPVHHILRRDDGHHHGWGAFPGNAPPGSDAVASSSVEVDDSEVATSVTEAAAAFTTSTDTDATTTSTAAVATSTVSGTTYTDGYATYFYQEGVAGACGTVHQDTDYIVAVQSAMYSSSLCGKTVVITAVSSGATVTATVADECPGCATSTSLDLSVAAFEALSDLSVGTFAITWVLED